MNKIVGYLSDKIEKRLLSLMEASNFDKEDITSININGTTKRILLDDGFVVLKTGHPGRFEANTNSQLVFSESLLIDFLIGYYRVRTQYDNLKKLVDSKDYNPSWPLVTAYYCAFFSAIDILRVFKIVNIGFDDRDIASLCSKIEGDYENVYNHRNYVGVISADYQKIKFVSSAEKPHKATWVGLKKYVFDEINKKKNDWVEIAIISNILDGKRNWSFPSDVRNNWNYKRADLFSSNGMEIGKEFKKIIGDSDKAVSWLSSNAICGGEKHHAASIAMLCEVLYSSIDNAYSNLFK